MKPDALIESYVADVVRHLPRRQRTDVGYELRSLLTEELHGRAAEPTSADALELLASFGRPVEVADRYRPAGFTIIRPAEAPRFAAIALIGVAVQWAGTLPWVWLAGGDWLNNLAQWWLSWGIGAFWWPGMLITFSIIGAAIGSRRETATEWTPREAAVLDWDAVNRPLQVLALAGGLVGVAIVIAVVNLATVVPGLPQPVLDAFVFDESFLAARAPWALLLWAVTFASMVVVLVAGRWTRATRVAGLVTDVLWIALLVWWVAAGPIFVQETADSVTKGCLILVAAFCALDLVLTARQLRRGIPEPVL